MYDVAPTVALLGGKNTLFALLSLIFDNVYYKPNTVFESRIIIMTLPAMKVNKHSQKERHFRLSVRSATSTQRNRGAVRFESTS